MVEACFQSGTDEKIIWSLIQTRRSNPLEGLFSDMPVIGEDTIATDRRPD